MKAVAEAPQARPLMPVEEALERLLALAEAAPIKDIEHVSLADAEGRVLATDLVARSTCRRGRTAPWMVMPCAWPITASLCR